MRTHEIGGIMRRNYLGGLNADQRRNYRRMQARARRLGAVVQLGYHGCGRYSVQLFVAGKLMSDCSI